MISTNCLNLLKRINLLGFVTLFSFQGPCQRLTPTFTMISNYVTFVNIIFQFIFSLCLLLSCLFCSRLSQEFHSIMLYSILSTRNFSLSFVCLFPRCLYNISCVMKTVKYKCMVLTRLYCFYSKTTPIYSLILLYKSKSINIYMHICLKIYIFLIFFTLTILHSN